MTCVDPTARLERRRDATAGSFTETILNTDRDRGMGGRTRDRLSQRDLRVEVPLCGTRDGHDAPLS